MSPSQGYDEIRRVVGHHIAETIKTLLETKHVYQSLEVATPHDAISAVVMEVKPAIEAGRNVREELALEASALMLARWNVMDPRGVWSAKAEDCSVTIPHVKTFCTVCDRIEPFNLAAATDYLMSPGRALPTYKVDGGIVQTFVLAFWCQGCKGIPEVFVVRRVGSKLTLCGRSPMEHVDVPKYLPPKAKEYVRGAIVAHQSGQTLAGLFLLRTSIEQWIRSLLGAEHPKADQAIEWYMSTLPDAFKSLAPSLRKVYENLSDAIHEADASAELFEQAKADIERHFDARRVAQIPIPRPPAAAPATRPERS